MGEKRRMSGDEDTLDEHKETSTAEGLRGHQEREEAGLEAPGRTGPATEGVLVLVCEKCGKQYTFDDEEPPDDLTCEKCGNEVFRSFTDATAGDEARADFERSTERDLATDDDASDVARGDVTDLNRR